MAGTNIALIILVILLLKTGATGPVAHVISSSPAMAPFFGLALYELAVLVWLWRHKDVASRGWFRWVNTLAELSVPTATILILGSAVGLAQSLVGAAPWLYFMLIVLTALYLDPKLCLAAGVWAAVQFSLLAYVATRGLADVPNWPVLTFGPAYILKAICLVMTGLASGFVALQIRKQLNATVQMSLERTRAISIFGQHVSPQVAEMLLNQPVKSTGEERTVCVMFLDIRNFSVYAAERAPGEVMDYLNALFSELIAVVNRHEGIINKFLGDGFMAVFGAPLSDGRQCEHAVEASREILKVVARLNAEKKIPETRVGIGLHLGEAVTGNVGSSERKEYTIIGDVVNLASRIEQATKQFQAQILVSEPVMSALQPDRYPAEDLGLVELKGQSKPARLYKLA